jgi:hypothetical protein
MVRCTDHGPTFDVRACECVFDEPVNGVWGSDHFGVVAELSAQTSSGRPVRWADGLPRHSWPVGIRNVASNVSNTIP